LGHLAVASFSTSGTSDPEILQLLALSLHSISSLPNRTKPEKNKSDKTKAAKH
jgi:hypothetical protein